MVDENNIKHYGYGDLAKHDLGYMTTVPKTRNTCQRAKVDCKLKHGLSLRYANYEEKFKCQKCEQKIDFSNRILATFECSMCS